MNFLKFAVAVVVSIFAFTGACASASEKTEAIEQAIQERVSILNEAWNSGDVNRVIKEVYGEDAVIQGEGQKETIKTAKGVKDIVSFLIGSSRSTKFEISTLRVLGDEAALTWGTWSVAPKTKKEKPFKVKALFVWAKGQEGWRIRADMYAMGTM